MKFAYLLLLGSTSAVKLAPLLIEYFATGMNGDEDLGQDIIMKGEKFHYKQGQKLAEIPTCSERITTNCQPGCSETLTRGCTETAAPEPPRRDRFEGNQTFK